MCAQRPAALQIDRLVEIEPVYCWDLVGEADPQLLARVLACFSVRNELPQHFCARRVGADRLQLHLRAERHDAAAAHRLSLRFLAIPSVVEVRWWSPDAAPRMHVLP